MQLKTIVAAALLPLLAAAEDTTTTSTMTMTKYVTISKVATSSVYANITTSLHHPIGTGYSTSIPITITSTSTSASATDSDGIPSPTSSGPTVSPTIDSPGGAGSLSAFGLAGVAGMMLAALM